TRCSKSMVGFQVHAVMYRDSLPGQLGIRIGSDDHRLAHQNRYFVRSVGPKSDHKAERIFGDLESIHAACLARSRSVALSAGVSWRAIGLVLLDHACWQAPSLAECDAMLSGPGPDLGAALAAGCRTGWSVPGFAGVLDEGG